MVWADSGDASQHNDCLFTWIALNILDDLVKCGFDVIKHFLVGSGEGSDAL